MCLYQGDAVDFSGRIKSLESGNNNKTEEKKEEPKKLSEKIKKLETKEPPKKEEKEKEKPKEEKPKSNNPFLEQINKKANSGPVISKQNIPQKTNSNKLDQPKFGGNFASKLSQMNEMFKKQGKDGFTRHRLTVTSPSVKFGGGKDLPGWKNNDSKNMGIINEEPDKMKAGYDPASNLQKTLDSVVVVQKNKKKKKMKPTFKG